MSRYLLALLAVLLAVPAAADDIRFLDAYVLTAGPQARNAAIYGTLRNGGTQDVVITGAVAPAAARTEIHETVTDAEGVARMQPLSGLTVPAGGTLLLAPQGQHVMLLGLQEPLPQPGDSVLLQLTTKGGTNLTVDVPVRHAAARAPTHDHSSPDDGAHSHHD